MTDQIIIRKTLIEDMQAVMDAHQRSIIDLCSKDYSDEQIKCWSNVNYSLDIWKNSVGDEFHLVVERDGRVEGLCHSCIHPDHIGEVKGLYLTLEVSGMGLARKCFENSLEYFKKHKCVKIIVTGTKTAKPFYEKMGFACVRECVQNVRGADLECYQMEMYLLDQ